MLSFSQLQSRLTEPFVLLSVAPFGAGKTTWAKALSDQYGLQRVTCDEHIMRIASILGLAFHDAYDDPIICNNALATRDQAIADIVAQQQSVIVDSPNTSAESRQMIIDQFPKSYSVIAVRFAVEKNVISNHLSHRDAMVSEATQHRLWSEYLHDHVDVKTEAIDMLVSYDPKSQEYSVLDDNRSKMTKHAASLALLSGLTF